MMAKSSKPAPKGGKKGAPMPMKGMPMKGMQQMMKKGGMVKRCR